MNFEQQQTGDSFDYRTTNSKQFNDALGGVQTLTGSLI